jgi:hypothetical protein
MNSSSSTNYILGILVCFFITSSVFAQIETDRPDFTESPNVVPKKSLQFETGFVYEKDVLSFCGSNETYENTTFNTGLIRYGLTNKIELRFNWSYGQSRTKSEAFPTLVPCSDNLGNFNGDTSFAYQGASPYFVGLKFNLFKNDKISLGLLTHAYLPFGAHENEELETIAPEFLLPCSYTINDNLSLAAQYGATWNGSKNASEVTSSYTFSVAYGLTNQLGIYVEPYGYFAKSLASDHRINGGFTYLVNNNFQLDLTGGAGLTPAAPDYFISCGLSVLFLPKKAEVLAEPQDVLIKN